MRIIHKLDNFLLTLFPTLKSLENKEQVINEIVDYFTLGPFKPKVSLDDDWITIDIDTTTIIAQKDDYRKVIALCEKGMYLKAKPLLEKLIEKNPTNSEYHRIMGQVLSDEGDQEEAIDSLIDALRWDPRNGKALIMMGNIFAKHRNDIETAITFYNQALKTDPSDYIAINNIGANLMNQNKAEEARQYFLKVLEINEAYPNAHIALGKIAWIDGDIRKAFEHSLLAVKFSKTKDNVYQNAAKLTFDAAKNLINSDDGKEILNKYRHELEKEGGLEIDIIEDSNISFAAKIEYAESYNHNKHVLRFKPDYPANEHLIMHELVHLDFAMEARKENENQVFVSTPNQKEKFIAKVKPELNNLLEDRVSEEIIDDVCEKFFTGLNSRVFNAPIDLFIEQRLFDRFPGLRPYQFISFFGLVQEGKQAVTDQNVIEMTPKSILSVSIIYNLVTAMQFRDMYGIDMLPEFNANKGEMKQAEGFYSEYLEYKDDRQPGEEYELIENWAKDLGIDKNFELINESKLHTNGSHSDKDILDAIEQDPFDLENTDAKKEKESKEFLESEKEGGTNMAVVMHMVGALEFFKDMDVEKIKTIAFEIAMQGTQGYNTQKKYRLNSIPNKVFTGYQILAYYYVSWALTAPDLVPSLALPFDAEYEMAMQLHKPKS
jgi:tetratricopeptide (TPR) repeat protein